MADNTSTMGNAIPGLMTGNALGALGSGLGMWSSNNSMDQGNADYQRLLGQGIDTLKQGQAGANIAFSPYTGAGTQGVQGATSDIFGRTQAGLPTLTGASPSQAMGYLNPSAAYSTDQANKAIEASSIAAGGMGGGLAKALSNNANKMAMTNYNNAYDQMLQTNNQNFSQQQQNYTNTNDYQQQQIANKMGLANMGLGATQENQKLQYGYNELQNQDLENMGATAWNTNASKAQNTNSGINNMFGGLGNLASLAGLL